VQSKNTGRKVKTGSSFDLECEIHLIQEATFQVCWNAREERPRTGQNLP